MPALGAAYEDSSKSFSIILEKLRPRLLIYDYCQGWAVDVASSFNIPSVQFLLASAAHVSVGIHFFAKPLSEEYPFPEICINDRELQRLQQTFGSNDPVFQAINKSCDIILIKSIRELEGKYIDYLSRTLGKDFLPVGSLIQESSAEEDDHEYTHIFRWLDTKKKSSVIFVSFGTEYYLSHNEIEDIAYSLENSGVSFIWVIRCPESSKTSLEQLLPDGFLERLGERSMVIEKWAPQVKILSHSSCAGFVSHCGWGSVMESLFYGVPIIGIPIQYDQPYNASIVETNGVGSIVRKGEDGRLNREELAETVRKVAADDGVGSIREKALELGEIMRRKGDEEVDKLVTKNLIKLCDLNN